MNETQTGVIKFFNPDKGFGFISIPGKEKDIFVHISNIDRSSLTPEHEGVLREGDNVEFEVGMNTRGQQEAKNVRYIDESDTDQDEDEEDYMQDEDQDEDEDEDEDDYMQAAA